MSEQFIKILSDIHPVYGPLVAMFLASTIYLYRAKENDRKETQQRQSALEKQLTEVMSQITVIMDKGTKRFDEIEDSLHKDIGRIREEVDMQLSHLYEYLKVVLDK